MKIKQALEQFGLNQKEVAIYLASLELGSASAQVIANKAKVQRTYFYDLSKKLIADKLLIKRVEGKKTFFEATSPDNLIDREKERLSGLKSILPELKAIHNPEGKKPKVYYHDGIEGIGRVNDDTLEFKGEIVGFTTPRFVQFKNEKMSREYIEKRKKAGIRVRIVGEDTPAINDLKKLDWKELRETRTLPKELFSSEVEIGIYGKKVFIVDYKEKYGLIIESKNLAQTFKKVFELVWGSKHIVK